MYIPFVDLKAQYHSIRAEIDAAIQSVIDETAFIKGKHVSEFESNYAKEYGVKHCISVANGTDALYIVMKMLGIGKDDEVMTSAHSWISSSETISQTGATPVFIDTDPDYFTLNADRIEAKITSRTKAIIPVHLYGQPADILKIKNICDKHHLYMIEDCAQSHFAEFKEQRVGTFGIAATFSFFPGKNLGAYGDAGAIITNDDTLADKFRMYANHGSLQKHNHQMEGINSRLDGLQAAILNVKLPYIGSWNQSRFNHALYYNQLLSGIPQVKTPKIREHVKHIFHVYCLHVENREKLMAFLKTNGIVTSIHYPTILPNLPAYSYLNHKPEDFPVASGYQNKILSLPMFPELTEEQVEYVVGKVRAFY